MVECELSRVASQTYYRSSAPRLLLRCGCMDLDMKTHCERCEGPTFSDAPAYVCSYGCTFCPSCAVELKCTCPNCTGELLRRPRRPPSFSGRDEADSNREFWGGRPWVIWAISFGIWTVVGLAATSSVYELNRSLGRPMSLGSVLGLELCQMLAFVPLTPIAFALATRFPLQRANWKRRSLLHLLFALVFSIGHITLRGLTPYAYWDPKLGAFTSVFWNSQTHAFEIQWQTLRVMFLSDVVDDITSTYIPIVFIAHAVSYYRSYRDRELHAVKLQMQLVRSRLQSLKSHLQPHFLFNTLHSISSLMLTDVKAADTMIARLSDLLRMTLESSGIQITCLNQELEFVMSYLEIERIRFGERLNVVLDIAPESLDAQVPSLLLQPLVENAIRHGTSRLSAGGNIWISARQDGSELHLKVRDSGPGLVKDVASATGTGLRTTRERLQTLYGSNQSLEIYDAADSGVEVSVKIPFRIESEMTFRDDELAAMKSYEEIA